MNQKQKPVEKELRLQKYVSKALGRVQAAPQAFMQPAAAPYESLSPQVRNRLVLELHTYPIKDLRITRIIWGLFGILGGHRFYLGQFGWGVLMLVTIGGCLIWWIVDGFKLKSLVSTHNDQQAERQRSNQPPLGMEYVPMVEPEVLAGPPEWAAATMDAAGTPQGKMRFFWEATADVIALMFFGYVLGAITGDTGYRTAAWAVLAIVTMINFADFLLPMHHWPVVNGMIHWDYRLRLFYHFNAPGRRLALYFRPLIGLFYAPFRPKPRAEVMLYLEIGSVFLVGKALMGLFGGETWTLLTSLDFGGFVEKWVQGIVLGFFTIYGFAAPIGAIMMKHVLLRRRNYVRWGLSLVALYFLAAGMMN